LGAPHGGGRRLRRSGQGRAERDERRHDAEDERAPRAMDPPLARIARRARRNADHAQSTDHGYDLPRGLLRLSRRSMPREKLSICF
jgi:hypothetical protein